MNENNTNNPNNQPQGAQPAPFPPGEGSQPQPNVPQTPPQQPATPEPQGGVPRPPREEETVDIRTMNDDVSSVESSGGSVGEPKTFRPKDLLNDEPQFKPDQSNQPNAGTQADKTTIVNSQPPKKKGLRMLVLIIIGVLLFAGIAFAGFVFVPRFFAEPAPVVVAEPIVEFTAEPTTIESGQSATLSWNVTGATSVNIEGVGVVEAGGAREVTPTQTTTYRLVATGEGGTSEAAIEITVISTEPQFQHVSMFTADANVTQVPLSMDAASVTTFHNLLNNASTNLEENAVVEILPLLNNQPMNSHQFLAPFLPALDEDYLRDTIAEDYTVFAYKDANGIWPGFMVTINKDIDGNTMDYSALTNAIEQLPTVFYSADPGTPASESFNEGARFNPNITSIRYLAYSRAGASFNIADISFESTNYLLWSTSFNGIREAVPLLGF